MTMQTDDVRPAIRPVRVLLGVLAGIGAHAVVIGAAFLAGRLAGPGEGFEDLATVVSILLLGEIGVFIGALVLAVVLFVKRRRDLGAGILLGWLAGPIAIAVLTLTQANSPN